MRYLGSAGCGIWAQHLHSHSQGVFVRDSHRPRASAYAWRVARPWPRAAEIGKRGQCAGGADGARRGCGRGVSRDSRRDASHGRRAEPRAPVAHQGRRRCHAAPCYRSLLLSQPSRLYTLTQYMCAHARAHLDACAQCGGFAVRSTETAPQGPTRQWEAKPQRLSGAPTRLAWADAVATADAVVGEMGGCHAASSLSCCLAGLHMSHSILCVHTTHS